MGIEVSRNGATTLHAQFWVKRRRILVPYEMAGCHTWGACARARPRKADCSGYQMRSMIHGGYEDLMREHRIIPAWTNCQHLYDKLAALGWDIPVGEARYRRGSLVFWYKKSWHRLGHVAIVVMPNVIVHASAGKGGVVRGRFDILGWNKAILLQ